MQRWAMRSGEPSTLPDASAAPPKVTSAILKQAMQWQVTLWSGEVSDAERDGLRRWLAEDPEHARAWEQVTRLDARLQVLASPAAAQALRAPRMPSSARRRMLCAAGFLSGGSLALLAVSETPQWQLTMADHGTRRGQRRQIALPDGTRVMLNTATAIDVRFDGGLRRVVLRTGEILVATATDVARPFAVQTAQGLVRAIGTRFTVRQASDASRVAVLEGAVEIHANGRDGPPLRLDAGQGTQFRHAAIDAPQALDAGAGAWERGLLVAQRMRLEDLLAELGRYRTGMLRCDPELRDLIVSGVYSLDDTDHALATLAQALRVRLQYATRYWVTVKAGAAGAPRTS